ncbi:MAG: tRNA pseudouridine(55) synthase TruB [Anaeromyxobacter sp.]
MAGVLVIDKPAGPTSHEVVARVRRALRAEKAGHAGTLDPAATGVLAVCVGGAVRLQQYLSDGDKAYEATVAFGAATDTEDAEGRVIEEGDPAGLDQAAVAAALPRFVGTLAQVPPMYSAVRVGGRRLHEAARAGEQVERTPRQVVVHAVELLAFGPASPGRLQVRLAVRCGKGTYVRTLAADLGRALGVPAHLAALRRTMASGFTLAQAVPLEEAERLAAEGGPAALEGRLVPLAEALGFLPAAQLTEREALGLVQGRAAPCPEGLHGLTRALDARGRLVAVCDATGDRLRPVRVLLTPGEVLSGAPSPAGQDG